jgi:hypothetical protein
VPLMRRRKARTTTRPRNPPRDQHKDPPMSRVPSTFRKRDLTAAIEAARAAGIQVARVEVDKDGKITIITEKPGVQDSGNDLDRELAEWEAHRGQG